MPEVSRLYRYPVKGLSPEPLDEVRLEPGEGFPLDRAFALAHGTAPFDPGHPEPLAKTHFLMLMKNERLARLETSYDGGTGVLSVRREGKEVVRGNLRDPVGRKLIEQFYAAWLGREVRGSPRLVQAPGHSFADAGVKVVSMINLASLRELERIVGRPVDHLRFRANLYFEGSDAWSEFEWIDREIAVGDARLRPLDRTQRCAAINVDPATAERDMNLPNVLLDTYGHADMGVYAKVVAGGVIARGDAFEAP